MSDAQAFAGLLALIVALVYGLYLVGYGITRYLHRKYRDDEMRGRFTPAQRALATKLALNASYGRDMQQMGVRTKRVVLSITIAQLTERSFLAVSEIGGMNIRGQRRPDELSAVQSLLSGLCGHDQSNAEGVLGLDLAIEGTDLQALAQLGDGNDDRGGDNPS